MPGKPVLDGSSEATVVRIGEKSTHKFTLIPKVRLVPDEPDGSLTQKIADPSQLTLTFPIEGQQTNLPKSVDCLLWWLVRGARTEDIGPIPALVNLKGDKFEILVDGQKPQSSSERERSGIGLHPIFPVRRPSSRRPSSTSTMTSPST